MGRSHRGGAAGQDRPVDRRGRRTRDNCEAIAGATEQAWCAKVGEGDANTARAALEELVSRLHLELPHYPITYGASDGSALGGPWVAAKPGPPRIPAHGVDWVPVVRGDGDTVSRLPLRALLLQALMAYLVDYEDRMPFPMAVAALIAQTTPGGGVPLADVPPVLAVDGAGKSGLERHGVVKVGGRGDQRIATVTPTGVRIRDAYQPTVDDVERSWRERYGAETVGDLVAALARVDAKLPGTSPTTSSSATSWASACTTCHSRRSGDGYRKTGGRFSRKSATASLCSGVIPAAREAAP